MQRHSLRRLLQPLTGCASSSGGSLSTLLQGRLYAGDTLKGFVVKGVAGENPVPFLSQSVSDIFLR